MRRLLAKNSPLHRQAGMSMAEIVVALAVVSIAAAIAIPKMVGNQNDAYKQASVNLLDSGWEIANDYYQGNRGPGQTDGPPDSFSDFSADTAQLMYGKINWHDWSSGNPALVVSQAKENDLYIRVAQDQSLGLCTANRALVWCKYDDGMPALPNNRLGPRWGASAVNSSEAWIRATSKTNPCNENPSQSETFARTGKC